MLSKHQCSFRKDCSSQYCLLAMTEKRGKSADDERVFKALLTDLPKSFDRIIHDCQIRNI